MLKIDGSYGEGGGQIIRTTLTLATILGQPVQITNIRAQRKTPGLAAQHLTAVNASALLCNAEITGAEIGSTTLTFTPTSPPINGIYEFNIADARTGGSAGATTLVLQTILLPLALIPEASEVTIRGGTHVSWSPSFHYIQQVYLPMLAHLGVDVSIELNQWGWYPAGEGEIHLRVLKQTNSSNNKRLNPPNPAQLNSLWEARKPLIEVKGIGVAANLPAHIAQRISDRASKLLAEANIPATVSPIRVRSVSPGAGLFLVAEYENCQAGFDILGRKGKTSEAVAEEAIEKLLTFHKSDAVFEEYLTDQLLLPMALTGLQSTWQVETLSKHTITNLWVIEQFLGPVATIDHHHNIIKFNVKEPV